jgi:hypothetical protein
MDRALNREMFRTCKMLTSIVTTPYKKKHKHQRLPKLLKNTVAFPLSHPPAGGQCTYSWNSLRKVPSAKRKFLYSFHNKEKLALKTSRLAIYSHYNLLFLLNVTKVMNVFKLTKENWIETCQIKVQ